MKQNHFSYLQILIAAVALMLVGCPGPSTGSNVTTGQPTELTGKLEATYAGSSVLAVTTNSPGEVIGSTDVLPDGSFLLTVDVNSMNTHIVIILKDGSVLKLQFDSGDATVGIVNKLTLKKGLGKIDLETITIVNGSAVAKLKNKNVAGKNDDDTNDDDEDDAVVEAVKAKFPNRNLGCSIWSTQPRANANVSEGGKKIKLRFALPVDKSTITAANIKLVGPDGNTDVALNFPGKFNEHDRQVTLEPTTRLAPGSYTLSVSTDVECASDVKLTQTDFKITFTVVAEDDEEEDHHLEIVSVVPSDNAVDVALDTKVTVTFDTNLDVATATAAAGHFLLRKKSDQTLVIGTILVSNKTLTFTPTADLAPNTAYEIVIGTDIKNTDGESLEDAKTTTFTTRA